MWKQYTYITVSPMSVDHLERRILLTFKDPHGGKPVKVTVYKRYYRVISIKGIKHAAVREDMYNKLNLGRFVSD